MIDQSNIPSFKNLDLEDCLGSLLEMFARATKPNPDIGIKDYCSQHMVLTSAESRIGGKVHFPKYFYQLMEDLQDGNGIEEVRCKKGRQLGFTLLMVAWMLWGAAVSPAPAMVVFPTGDAKKKFSKQKLGPIFKRCVDLKGLIDEVEVHEKGDKDTLDIKNFPGGFVNISSANSSSSLRSSSIRRLGLDEKSAYPDDCQGEGNPSDIAYGTTSSFGNTRKVFSISTPKVKGTCPIDREVSMTQQFKFHVPCLKCGHFQTIEWGKIIFPEKTQSGSAEWECEKDDCKHRHRNEQKDELIDKGEWRSTADDPSGGKVRGYCISALYAPSIFFSWDDAVKQFKEAKGDLEKTQAFVNNVLGEAWELPSQKIDLDGLKLLASDYPVDGNLPEGAALVTAGVDTHPQHIDIVIKAWGRGQESWVIGYEVIHKDANKMETWYEVDRILRRTYRHPSGAVLCIAAACIDTGGHNTQAVYDFVAPRFDRRIIGIKGVGQEWAPTIGNPTKNNLGDIPIFPVGRHSTMTRVFSRFKYSLARYRECKKEETPYTGPNVCHFPSAYLDDPLRKALFSQLSAPRSERKTVNGRSVTVFKTTDGVADHAFDCYRYADAALYYLNWDIDQICDHLESDIEIA